MKWQFLCETLVRWGGIRRNPFFAINSTWFTCVCCCCCCRCSLWLYRFWCHFLPVCKHARSQFASAISLAVPCSSNLSPPVNANTHYIRVLCYEESLRTVQAAQCTSIEPNRYIVQRFYMLHTHRARRRDYKRTIILFQKMRTPFLCHKFLFQNLDHVLSNWYE